MLSGVVPLLAMYQTRDKGDTHIHTHTHQYIKTHIRIRILLYMYIEHEHAYPLTHPHIQASPLVFTCRRTPRVEPAGLCLSTSLLKAFASLRLSTVSTMTRFGMPTNDLAFLLCT
jgi:hypothetical protein